MTTACVVSLLRSKGNCACAATNRRRVSTVGFRKDNIPTFVLARSRVCAVVRQRVKCPRSILSARQHASQPGVGPNTMQQVEPLRTDLPIVLLTGASGYVGGRMIPLLERQPVMLRCLARNPDKLRPRNGSACILA